MNDSEERWLPVVGFNDSHEVSSNGRIRTIDRIANGGRRDVRHNGKIMRVRIDRGGYPRARIVKNGRTRYKFVHRLVAEAFLGPPPEGLQVDHKNGVKLDNRLSNLEYVSAKENVRRAYDLGLRGNHHGERNPNSKLTEQQVLWVRSLPRSTPISSISTQVGVSYSRIKAIRARTTWTHLK